MPQTVPSQDEILAERLWKGVAKGGADECWPWMGWRDKDGYGRIKRAGKNYLTHRLALLVSRGPIPHGMEVLHSCDNPPCCNPAHLVAGTHQRNMAERDQRGRQASGERNGRAKLTKDTVLAIRSEYVPRKVTARALSARHGVNICIVRDIVNRVTWRGVESEETQNPRQRAGMAWRAE